MFFLLGRLRSIFLQGRKSIFAIQVQISHILKLQCLRHDSCRKNWLGSTSELQRGLEVICAK